MNDRQKAVCLLCDGILSSKQIALILGENKKYVQKIMLKFDLPRRKKGSAFGELNGSYKTGRRIDRDGYVLVSAPIDHPNARHRKNRNTGLIYEHRLVMEKKIGRYLTDLEIVYHIDGLRLHNSPDNLRLFENNSHHLKETITGRLPNWSKAGFQNILKQRHHFENFQPVDTYGSMKKNGDARLREILLSALKLGIDSQYLLGTHHHLEKAGIFDFSHSNLIRALDDLYRKYA